MNSGHEGGREDHPWGEIATFLGLIGGLATAAYVVETTTFWLVLAVILFSAAGGAAVIATRPPARHFCALVFGAMLGILIGIAVASSSGGGSIGYAKKLNEVFVQLERRRNTAYRLFERARDSAPEKHIAHRLGITVQTEARSLRPAPIGADEQVAAVRIRHRLDELSGSLFSLARATADPRGGQKHLDHVAARVTRAQQNLIHSERALARHGYHLSSF